LTQRKEPMVRQLSRLFSNIDW